MKNKIKYCLIFILVILLQSCASFNKELINPNRLNKGNLIELNGKYKIVQNKSDSIFKEHNRQIWQYNNFLTEIDRKLIKDTLKIDTLKAYAFGIKIISPKKIQIDYLENGKVFRERILKVKLKKDGYLYLKNKNVRFFGVPYLFGGLNIKKSRMTIDKDKNLLVDFTKHRSAAALLFIELNFRHSDYRNEYKRIK